MSLPPIKRLSAEWIWRILIGGGVAAQLWLSNHYVTRAEYAVDRRETSETLRTVAESVTSLRMSIALQQSAQEKLSDHETRIRTLEQRKANQ